MLDLIGLIAGILEAWYSRRVLAGIAAIVFLVFGVPQLLNLPSSADFGIDLAKGLSCTAVAVVLLIYAFRAKKS